MKRILFLSPLPPPFYGSGISSKMCLEILKADGRFEVTNIKTNYSKQLSDIGKINISKIKGLIHVAIQIRHFIKDFDPEIIYYMPATSDFGLLRDSLFLGIIKMSNPRKLILHIRTLLLKKDWDNPLKKSMLKRLLHCDKVIILGPELIENLNGQVDRNKIFILPNAIPNSLSDKEFESLNNRRRKSDHLDLLFLSLLEESKGWFKLLEACKLLCDDGVKFTCHFVGDWRSDQEKQKFYRFIRKNNLSENIVYHGMLIGKEKSEMLAKADILVFPTENDAFGRVIIEAMEYGVPVIANNVGTIPSIIDNGKTGFILEKNQADEICTYILKLQNKDYRKLMGIKSRVRFLERFTIGTYRNRFIDIINED